MLSSGFWGHVQLFFGASMKTTVRHRLRDLVQQAQTIPATVEIAARVAINSTLPRGRDAIYSAMRRAFVSPTPYALNALRLELVPDGGALAGAVMVKGRQDVPGGAVPAQSFLRAEITGGARRWKRFEVALMKRGHLPRGWFAIPAIGARLDRWGNMSRGQVVELMSWLELFGTARGARAAGYRANKTEASKAKARAGTRNRFGVDVVLSSPTQAYRRGGLPFGIYTRQTNARTTRAAGPPKPLLPVVVFVKSANYRQRLDYFGELQRATAQDFPQQLALAVDKVRRLRPLKDVR